MTNTATVCPRQEESSIVLIVDDNVSGAQTLQMLLSLEGYEVVVASTGKRAIELYNQYHPDIVLLDIGLPDTDGYSVANHLRNRNSTPPPLIIAMTGWGDLEHRQRAIAAGCDYHLSKPVHFDDLQSMLKKDPKALPSRCV